MVAWRDEPVPPIVDSRSLIADDGVARRL